LTARYQWPASAMSPTAARPAAPTLEVGPAVTPEPMLVAPVNVADGWHEGYRWWATRHPDALNPIVHIQGWDGPRYVSMSREMENASPAKVKRWIETVIAQIATDAAKKRGKGRG
jgi:hypothetical protein